jgi:hypothetical protein
MIQTPGAMDVQAGWVGNTELNGASSNVATVWIVPVYLVVLVCGAAVLVALVVTLFVKVKRRKLQVSPSSGIESVPSALA